MSAIIFSLSAARPMFWAAALFLLTADVSPGTEFSGDASAGRSHYTIYCVICHGTNMVNSGARSYDLRKFPLDARDRFFKSVKNGKRDMPAWKDLLDDQKIEDLWAYMKTRGK